MVLEYQVQRPLWQACSRCGGITSARPRAPMPLAQDKYFALRKEAQRIRSEADELRLDKHLNEEEKKAALLQAAAASAERREQTERAASEAAAAAVAAAAERHESSTISRGLGACMTHAPRGALTSLVLRAADMYLQRADPVAQMYSNLAAGRQKAAGAPGPTVRTPLQYAAHACL